MCRKEENRNSPENLSIWSVFALIIALLLRFFFFFLFFLVSWKSSGRFHRFISFHALHPWFFAATKRRRREIPFRPKKNISRIKISFVLGGVYFSRCFFKLNAKRPSFFVRKFIFLVISYNTRESLKKCLELTHSSWKIYFIRFLYEMYNFSCAFLFQGQKQREDTLNGSRLYQL